MNRFDEFFRAATRHAPYDYQCRLACGERRADETEETWLAGRTACRSQLINIPTGLGKTAAVVLAWLWNRLQRPNGEGKMENGKGAWPRRLVYCLPMRTLVEQTRDNICQWLLNLRNAWADGRLPLSAAAAGDLLWLTGTRVQGDPAPSDSFRLQPSAFESHSGLHVPHSASVSLVHSPFSLFHSPVILMGGEEAGEWDIYPEHDAILIGTQDMLLSRALNRGYGMSRYRWPMHFGLLNNDCLWVMDETQLMGVSVETSAQLAGFRAKWPAFGNCPTWWMSATLDQSRLATVDHPRPDAGWPMEQLSPEEKASGRPHQLFTAAKTPVLAPFKLTAATVEGYAHQVAKLAVDTHKPGTLTLVVVNRVKRAQKIYEALTTAEKKGRQTTPPLYDPSRVALIHSRFRRADRQRHEALLFGEGDRIVVATQAVEAGVDVSARLLITELAPWSSLVQRIGRCNRRAEHSDAQVLWVDLDPDAKGELLLPYSADALEQARTAIRGLADASPRALAAGSVPEAPVVRPVIRRRDLVDLFDTTPDLCGQDLDISRYLRDEHDNDVQFFWRQLGDTGPTPDDPPPQRDELCRVSIGEAAKSLNSEKVQAWQWNPLAEAWEIAKSPRPGATYLLTVASGGYSEATGWTGDSKDRPTPYRPPPGASESYPGDPLACARDWQTLAEHTARVVGEAQSIASALALDDAEAATLRSAALWHDVGKAHAEFRQALRDGPHLPPDPEAIYAKSKNPPKRRTAQTPYRSIRHELASALAWLLADTPHAPGPPGAAERDLVAYLIAAHHGKVRLSIRSLPDEPGNPGEPESLFARGLWQGDRLPAVTLGELTVPEVTLDLRFMLMGESELGPSWLARALALRDRLGPFRLAYLETLLRAADARASRS